MPGPETALEFVGHFRQIDVESLRLRIHLFLIRRPDYGIAFGLQSGAILLECARVPVEILSLSELQAVDENRGDRHWRQSARDVHQAQVPFMNIAHGRHAGHQGFVPEPLAQLRDCVDDFHFPLGTSGRW